MGGGLLAAPLPPAASPAGRFLGLTLPPPPLVLLLIVTTSTSAPPLLALPPPPPPAAVFFFALATSPLGSAAGWGLRV